MRRVITVTLPDETFNKAKEYAKTNDVKVSSLVNKALQHFLEGDE